MSHDDDYPTNDELDRLRSWDLNDPRGWLEFARSLWWSADWGWPVLEGEVSTGGWSGNEALQVVIELLDDARAVRGKPGGA